MAEIKYRKEVLIATRQFENTRVAVEMSAECTADNQEATLIELRERVNMALLDDIVRIKTGQVNRKFEAEREKVKRDYNL